MHDIPDSPDSWLRDVAATVFKAVKQALRPAPLPPRVRGRVQREQERAEILIGLMQVAAIVTFGVLWVIARLTNGSPMMIDPIPLVLGVYAIFTGLRLWLAWYRRLRRGLIAISLVIDIAVLMALIWTFHLGYAGPATIYLKSPTLMYVFILIALRALRLEPGYVLLAGITAATLWAVLLAYALITGRSEIHITHSFQQYATSASVFLGAEFDRFVSILLVSAILALVVTRGRQLLVETAQGELALADFSHFVDPQVADRLRTASTEVMAGIAERRQVAILMTDLRGFTAFSRKLDADGLLRLLAAYQAAIVPAIQRHGGSIDKYLGDGILASFGAVTPCPTYAADAMRAMEDVLDAAASWARRQAEPDMPSLAVGAALATGDALFGTIGYMSRLEYTVIGDPVNVAAKLEKHTKVEAVPGLATDEAFQLARSQGYVPRRTFELRRHRDVAGLTSPIDLVVFSG
jgi:adenylate cyclase